MASRNSKRETENRMKPPDPFAELKSRQREMWACFTPTAIFTTPVAGQLVTFAGIGPDQDVRDVGRAPRLWRSPPCGPARG
jgi:hypothetical protein